MHPETPPRGARRGLILCALALLAAPAAARADVAATLTPATPHTFADRQAGAGPGAARTYTVTNTGSDPLAVAAATVTGAHSAHFRITEDGCGGRQLAAGETCSVRVALDPQDDGLFSGALQIGTNGPTLTSAAFSGRGHDLAATPAALRFTARTGTASAAQTVRIVNEAAAPHALGALSVPARFAIAEHTCTVTLQQGEGCDVTVVFNPTVTDVVAGSLGIAGFGPAPVALTGEGTQPAGAIAPAAHEFGVRPAAQAFTLRNTGNAALEVGAVALHAPGFALRADGCSDRTVAPGATCAVEVEFAPTTPGWRAGRLRIPTDAGEVVARVSGRGPGAGLDPDPLAPVRLGGQPLVRIQGDGEDTAGSQLASGPCDVDGDGTDDVIAGAPRWSTRPAQLSWEGAVYVTFGGPGIGATDLAAQGALRIEGVGENSFAGAVDCAGDVDGDGIDDLVIGAWGRSHEGRDATGEAWVVFGARDLRTAGPLDLGLLGDRGYRIHAPDAPAFDHLGYAVAGLGDVDGDGLGDVAVMGNTADSPGRTNNGVTYVLPGQRGTGDVDVAQRALLTIHGASQPNDLANAGDVNGDGADDIAIGAYTAVFAGRSTASGAAFVVSGRARGSADLADPAAALLVVGGPHPQQRLGIGVDAAGDVNGDGFGDVVLGGDATAGTPNSDNAYVVFGGPEPATLDASQLGDRGYRILGAPHSALGYGVAGVGDVDGDGSDDVAVGAYDEGGTGAVYLIHGQPDPAALPANDESSGMVPVNPADTTRYVSLATLTPEQGSRLAGLTAGERFGRQVAGIGDVDGNGARDLAIGADFAFRLGRSNAGEVTVALLPGRAPAAPADPPLPPPGGPSPGGDPAPGGPPPPAGTNGCIEGSGSGCAPRVALASRRVWVDARSRVRVTLRCAAGAACRGSVRLTLGGKRGAAKRVALRAGKHATVRIPLSRAQRRALRRKGTARGRLAVTLDGTTRTFAVTIRKER